MNEKASGQKVQLFSAALALSLSYSEALHYFYYLIATTYQALYTLDLTVQCRSQEPHVASEHLKCGYIKLRCAESIKFTMRF